MGNNQAKPQGELTGLATQGNNDQNRPSGHPEPTPRSSRMPLTRTALRGNQTSRIVSQSHFDAVSNSRIQYLGTSAFGRCSDVSEIALPTDRSMIRKLRGAIAIEVLAKFENSMRECPAVMVLGNGEEEGRQVLQMMLGGCRGGPLDFDVFEPEPLPIPDLVQTIYRTERDAKTHGYPQVVRHLDRKREKSVQELDFSKHNIRTTIDLSIFTNLERLNLSNNQIAEIGDLGVLPRLIHLDLSVNQLIAIQNLHTYVNLTQLLISRNRLSKIEGLGALRRLQILDLSHNQIVVMEGMGALASLKRLNLSGNQITVIQDLDAPVRLQWLDLSSNLIQVIDNLSTLFGLRSLNLRHNQIKTIENLVVLKAGASLDLTQNPINRKGNGIAINALTARKVHLLLE